MDHRSAGLAESRLPRTREHAVRRAVGRRGAAPRAARVPALLRGRARADARGRYQLRHQAGHPPGSRETRRALSRSPLSQHLLPDRHPLDRRHHFAERHAHRDGAVRERPRYSARGCTTAWSRRTRITARSTSATGWDIASLLPITRAPPTNARLCVSCSSYVIRSRSCAKAATRLKTRDAIHEDTNELKESR